MKLSRNTALYFHTILDQWVPPFIRDCRFVMAIPMRMMFGRHAKNYMDFQQTAFQLSEEEFRQVYIDLEHTFINRETDLNKECIEKILTHTTGPKVLEAGCGDGYLAKLLSRHHTVTAMDIVISDELRSSCPDITFAQGSIETLPFPDKYFDTVVCTHTLEHMRDIHRAVSELRRVAKKMIIVVPKQRPYKYTFDLHLHFFPYRHSLLAVMGKSENNRICENTGGDWFYMETVS